MSGSQDGSIRIWDAVTGAQVGTSLRGHSAPVSSVAFSPNGKCIVSGSRDNTVRLWSAVSQSQIGDPLSAMTRQLNVVAFSNSGQWIVSNAHVVKMLVDEMDPSRVHDFLPDQGPASIQDVAFTPDSKKVVYSCGNRTFTVEVMDDGKVVQTSNYQLPQPEEYNALVLSVACSPDLGSMLVASGCADCSIRLWNLSDDRHVRVLQGHKGAVFSIAFSPSGKQIVSGSQDHTIRVWDSEKAIALGVLHGHNGPVNSVHFSPDGERILSASHDHTIRVWDTYSFNPLEVTASPDSQLESSSDKPSSAQALPPAQRLFGDSQFSAFGWTDSVQMDDDGWIVGTDSNLVLWIPFHLRGFFHQVRGTLVVDGGIELDLSNMAHGSEWNRCRDLTETRKDRL